MMPVKNKYNSDIIVINKKKHPQNSYVTVRTSVELCILLVGSVGCQFLGIVPAFLGNICLYYHGFYF